MRKVQGVPQPLGVTIYEGYVNFACSAPEGKLCELLLYRTGEKEPEKVYEMSEQDAVGEVRFMGLADFLWEEYEYNFRVDTKLVSDPYTRAVSGNGDFGKPSEIDGEEHALRNRIVGNAFDWEGDKCLHIPYSDVIAYSLHVRGFTKDAGSKVKHKGTFMGIIEKLPYLKELGINQIHCMPVYDFPDYENGKPNYWGYGPASYFAPKSAYGAGGCAADELKMMVKACHAQGIEVVLEMPFTEGVFPQLVEECLHFYVIHYHIDGFVLNAYNAPMESLMQDPLLKRTKLMKKEDGFQNVMRRFLKGDEGMIHEVMWALRHNPKSDGVFNYITQHTGFTLHDLVSYDKKHNELNGERNQDGPDYNYSWNCGAEGPSRKKSVVSLRKNQVKNAFFLLLLAQGTPCILAGDEFGNTQKGNNNVYCQDNSIAWLNWNGLKRNEELLVYVKSLIALRKEYPVLHNTETLAGLDQISCGVPDVSYHGESAWQTPSEVSSRQLGIFYSGEGMKNEDCFVAYNMHWLEHSFALPSLGKKKKWYLVAETEQGVLEQPKLLKNQKEIGLKERTIAFLIGK